MNSITTNDLAMCLYIDLAEFIWYFILCQWMKKKNAVTMSTRPIFEFASNYFEQVLHRFINKIAGCTEPFPGI